MPLSKKIITYAAEIINGIINFGTKTPSAHLCRGRCCVLFLEGGFGDGDVREAVALAEAAAQVLVSAVHRAGAAAAGHKIVDVSGLDLLAAEIAADGIFNDLHSVPPSFYLCAVQTGASFARGTRKAVLGCVQLM